MIDFQTWLCERNIDCQTLTPELQAALQSQYESDCQLTKPPAEKLVSSFADCPARVHRVKPVEASADCLSHIPPFDAVESPDLSRYGWIRSDCRKCGKFLGYRPQEYQ